MPEQNNPYPQQPFQVLNGLANLNNTLLYGQGQQMQNQLTQGKLALGATLQKNTVNGQTDWDQAYQDATQNPLTAPVANTLLPLKDAAQQPVSYTDENGIVHAVTQQERQRQLTGAAPNPSQITPQADAIHDKIDAFQQPLQDLIADPNLTKEKAQDLILQLHTSEGMPAASAAALYTSMPDDPNQLRVKLAQELQAVNNMKKQATQQFGQSTNDVKRQAKMGATATLPTIPASRANLEEVQKAASGAPAATSAYNEALNLASLGDEHITGDQLASIREKLAETGIVPIAVPGATKTQQLEKWIAQGLLAQGMPTSDARLAQLQSGNIKPDQLPATIRELAPYFKAQEQAMLLKQNYYLNNTKGGLDLSKEPALKANWDNNYDPRFMELNALPNRDAVVEFLRNHPDLAKEKDKYNRFNAITGQKAPY